MPQANRIPEELKESMQEHLRLHFDTQDASDEQVRGGDTVVRCGAVRCGAVRCGAVRCVAVRCLNKLR